MNITLQKKVLITFFTSHSILSSLKSQSLMTWPRSISIDEREASRQKVTVVSISDCVTPVTRGRYTHPLRCGYSSLEKVDRSWNPHMSHTWLQVPRVLFPNSTIVFIMCPYYDNFNGSCGGHFPGRVICVVPIAFVVWRQAISMSALQVLVYVHCTKSVQCIYYTLRIQ